MRRSSAAKVVICAFPPVNEGSMGLHAGAPILEGDLLGYVSLWLWSAGTVDAY